MNADKKDLQVTFICFLKNEDWGFYDLMNGRKVNECKSEIIELLFEDIMSVLEHSVINIEPINLAP